MVDTVECGVVGRDPASECTVDAFKDCIVPIFKKEQILINYCKQ